MSETSRKVLVLPPGVTLIKDIESPEGIDRESVYYDEAADRFLIFIGDGPPGEFYFDVYDAGGDLLLEGDLREVSFPLPKVSVQEGFLKKPSENMVAIVSKKVKNALRKMFSRKIKLNE